MITHLNRRGLLAVGANIVAATGAIAAVPALAAVAPVGTDAELLALATRYASVNAEIRRLEAGDDDRDDAVFEPLDDSRHEVRERARNLMAATTIGLRAKAKIIVAELDLLGIDTPDEGSLADLAASLARDVVRVTGRA